MAFALTQQVAMLRKMHVRLNTAAIEISARGSDVTRLSMRCGALPLGLSPSRCAK